MEWSPRQRAGLSNTHSRRFHRSFCWKKYHSTGRVIGTPFGLPSSRGGGGSRPPFAARLRSSLAFVDVVVTTTAAEQFGPWCSASDVEGGRDGRNGVCLGDNEQKGDAHGGCASYWSTPAEAEQRPRGHPVVPYRPILWGHKLLPEWAVGSSADGQVPGHSVTRDVDRLSTEQRAKTVEQSQCEDSTTVLERGHHRRGQAVGEWGLGDRCC